MSTQKMEEPQSYAALEEQLGHAFADHALCEAALTHKSWLNEAVGTARTDNERLEFLGDAVLALVVSDLLMKRFPDRTEGELSKARAVIVSEAGLSKTAQGMGLGQWIFLGRGEDQAGGRGKASILSDALEALMGAVYLDGGLVAARAVAERLFADGLRDAEAQTRHDYKSRLQERSQALLQATPQYRVVGQEGPDHDKRFSVTISLAGREYGRAVGRSKKEAEQSAAALALEILERPREPT
ncbi:MAG TPA: ribonuclease III [Polyangia bacterium]|jgi:ribonuclease-3|nr:ribonuclease III [Polyangia bacterium]